MAKQLAAVNVARLGDGIHWVGKGFNGGQRSPLLFFLAAALTAGRRNPWAGKTTKETFSRGHWPPVIVTMVVTKNIYFF